MCIVFWDWYLVWISFRCMEESFFWFLGFRKVLYFVSFLFGDVWCSFFFLVLGFFMIVFLWLVLVSLVIGLLCFFNIKRIVIVMMLRLSMLMVMIGLKGLRVLVRIVVKVLKIGIVYFYILMFVRMCIMKRFVVRNMFMVI